MKAIIDLLIINVSVVMAFVLRELWGSFPDKPPSFFMGKYLLTILALNLVYLFLLWILGAYDRRQKRALLEEFVLIFGVISTGLFVLLTFLFMGRMWWMSRGIIYMFWAFSIVLLCLSRMATRGKTPRDTLVVDLSRTLKELENRKKALEKTILEPVSIVIVTYNSREKIGGCLDSLLKADLKIKNEIIVVDNASLDDTAAMIADKYPRIRLIKNQNNLGYSKAVNQGIRAAGSNLILILNPDMTVFPGTIEVMMEYMIINPEVGLAGCKLLNRNGSLQYSARRFLDLRTYLYRFTPLRGLLKGSALERSYLMQDWDHNEDRDVDWVLGGCMLGTRSAINKVGLMDENLFLYFEDTDWCFRMWDKGYRVAYIKSAVMVHEHLRLSANRLLSRPAYEHFKSLLYYLRKHGLQFPKNCPSSWE